MKRREFLTGLGGAVAWPLAAHAQQPKKIPRVGVLWHAGSAEEEAVYLRVLTMTLNRPQAPSMVLHLLWGQNANNIRALPVYFVLAIGNSPALTASVQYGFAVLFRMVAVWRPTADEDGHYQFAIPL
jgi:hypothetical protein